MAKKQGMGEVAPKKVKTRAPRKQAMKSGASARRTGWVWPTLSTRITQYPSPGHMALDIGGDLLSPIVAPVGGTITATPWQPMSYGQSVRLTTPEGYVVVLAHLQGLEGNLRVGQTVQAGQVVGYLGSSGETSTGPHLHLEIRAPGYAADRFVPGTGAAIGAIDPRPFLTGAPVVAPGAPAEGARIVFAPQTHTSVSVGGSPSGTPLVSSPKESGAARPISLAEAGARLFAGQRPTEAYSERMQKASSSPGGIPILSTPLGPISIAQPGALFTKWAIIALGATLIIIGVVVLALRAQKSAQGGRLKTAERLVKVAGKGAGLVASKGASGALTEGEG